jgi:GNAT superfamily N-acetyltransferase
MKSNEVGAPADAGMAVSRGDTDLVDLRSEVADATERARLCEEFYLGVYKSAFPKPDQAESPDVWLPLLEEDHPPPAPILHLIVARTRNGPEGGAKVVGGIAIEYFRRSKAALATYLAVAPDQRRKGLGRHLLANAIEKVSQDNGGVSPPIFAEVERPEAQVTDAQRRSAQGRLSVIAALGGRKLEIVYIQPKLGTQQHVVNDLMLVLLQSSGQIPDGFPAATVRAFLDEFFGSLGQRETPEFGVVADSLPAGRIALKELHAS